MNSLEARFYFSEVVKFIFMSIDNDYFIMVLGFFSIFYVALYIKFIFMSGVYEDLVTPYLGPGFC